jgi:ubiquinol-cytochrome c reductase cytochrome c subunit
MPPRHAVLSLLVLAAALVMTDRADAASVDNGRRAFMRVGCWQCHGTLGQGAVTGPKLAPDPLPLDALASFVRSSNRNMPPYREQVLSDDDLADIHAYLQSIPKGPDPKSIPLLQP